MTEQTDLIDSPIDARARDAAVALTRTVAHMPTPERRRPRQISLLRPIVVICTVAILMVGLVAIPRMRHEPVMPAATTSVPVTAPDIRWVLGTLPAGWSLQTTQGPSSSDAPPAPAVLLLATSEAPNGAIAQVAPKAQNPHDNAAATNVADITVSGVELVTADSADGTRLAYSPAVQVLVTARNVGPREVELLAAAVTLDSDGTPTIPATALPAGLSVVSESNTANASVAIDLEAGDVAISTYGTGPTGDGTMFLAVGLDGPRSAALLGLQLATVTTVRLPDRVLYSGTYGDGTVRATWSAKGLSFTIAAQGLTQDQVVELVPSVKPAEADTWAAVSVDSSAPATTGG